MSSKTFQEIHGAYDVSLQFAGASREQLNHCRAALAAYKQLILMGTGASLNACKIGQYAFMKYGGLIPHVIPASDVALLDRSLDEDTLVILVSQSGQSYETQVAVEYLKKRGVTVWGITNNEHSALGTGADETLLMNAGEEVSSATKTYVATLLILFTLAAGEEAGFPPQLRQIPDAIRESIRRSEERISEWAAALEKHDNFYLLGAGAFGVTAQQGALVLKEKTFQHVEGMSLSEFRHGNIEVIRPGLPIVILAAADSVDDSLKHAEHLVSLSALVYLVVDRDVRLPSISQERIIVLPGQPNQLLAQICAVLPLMLLAEKIAALKGHDIDGFRYISKVVDQYQ
ncbi:SIS domain-containing protein [Cohnella pontilimi]|uniref:Glutamine--fructose-6-phosphate aminotransferase [isomerizing] n=1 Tax=Cohnella pontilimi TaxID=2564100 RepID=A0A4U0FGN4_9BACL|nr:SIS domain-containing protein [Cohnella pontilimi]TJY43554.1 SIS domain-containing protein [Cohnella pontilimi]